jgi:uncharacterized protein YukE
LSLQFCIQCLTRICSIVIDFSLTAGGFIDKTPGSENFGGFSVAVSDLDLFDADGGLRSKLQDLRNKVASSSSDNPDQCNAVLSQFHTACDPLQESCSQANQQSFQVTVDQVCAAVNTPTKLKFDAIGDEFDRFADESGESESQDD